MKTLNSLSVFLRCLAIVVASTLTLTYAYAANLTLPSVTVTSMGTAIGDNFGIPAYWSGFHSLYGMGSGLAGSFGGGRVNIGDTITVSFKPAAGKVFSLSPGYSFMEAAIWFDNLNPGQPSSYFISTFEFLGVVGGSISNFHPQITYPHPNQLNIFSELHPAQPDAPITFTELKATVNVNSSIVFNSMPLLEAKFYSADFYNDTAYLKLVPAVVPEPSIAAFFTFIAVTGMSLRRRFRT